MLYTQSSHFCCSHKVLSWICNYFSLNFLTGFNKKKIIIQKISVRSICSIRPLITTIWQFWWWIWATTKIKLRKIVNKIKYKPIKKIHRKKCYIWLLLIKHLKLLNLLYYIQNQKPYSASARSALVKVRWCYLGSVIFVIWLHCTFKHTFRYFKWSQTCNSCNSSTDILCRIQCI